MKKTLLTSLSLFFILSACKKKETDGTLTVWTSCQNCGNIEVKISSESMRTLTHHYLSEPKCKEDKTLYRTLSPGTYQVTAESQTGTWNETATIKSGSCYKLELTN
jgi:subtilisin-like proprotein convertase family protein